MFRVAEDSVVCLPVYVYSVTVVFVVSTVCVVPVASVVSEY